VEYLKIKIANDEGNKMGETEGKNQGNWGSLTLASVNNVQSDLRGDIFWLCERNQTDWVKSYGCFALWKQRR
jgi:hypothetical protein